jgi:hypothetical protein
MQLGQNLKHTKTKKISSDDNFILNRIYRAGIQDACDRILHIIAKSNSVVLIEKEIDILLNF